MSKASRTSRSSGGSSSGKKMSGFGAHMEDGRVLMKTKREGSKSKKGKGKHVVLQVYECADVV